MRHWDTLPADDSVSLPMYRYSMVNSLGSRLRGPAGPIRPGDGFCSLPNMSKLVVRPTLARLLDRRKLHGIITMI